MTENRVKPDAHNACGGTASNAIHGRIKDFLMCAELRSGVDKGDLPCVTA